MTIDVNKTYEYEVKELIKAFGIENFDSINLEIKEGESSLFFNLNYEKTDYQIVQNKEENIDLKTAYKQGVYQLFSKALDKKLPWGILTGIRPVKLMQKLEKKTQQEIKEILKDKYYISKEKIKDMIDISKVQNNLIKEQNLKESIAIYIAIPFCPSRCNYCSFFSSDISKTQKLVKPYIKSLLKEIDLVLPYIKDKTVSSLYFGGGTPSALERQDIKYLLEEIDKRWDFSQIYEVCFEAGRPDTLTEEKLRIIKDKNIHRISINPQSMNDNTLKAIGRNHNKDDIITAYKKAREVGLDNINMDIILGLENEDASDVKRTMEILQKLDPDSITVHTLAKKRASKLYDQKQTLKEHDITKQMEIARKYCEDMDLTAYYLYRQKNIKGNLENLGFSKKGKASAYNVGIMEEIQSIIAFGAGGMSKICYPQENRLERVENVKSLEEYLKRYEEMAQRKISELKKTNQ